VAVTFGCWTSVSRKSVLPVFEELNGLLFYPVQYEGEESSSTSFTPARPRTSKAIPAVEYLMSKKGGGAKRFVLLGTDYVYPRTTNQDPAVLPEVEGHRRGRHPGEVHAVRSQRLPTIVAEVKKFAAGKRTAVISTINGDSNVPFYKRTANQGLKASDIPVVAFSVGEEELRGIDHQAAGRSPGRLELLHVDPHPENKKFIDKWMGLRQGQQPARRRQARDQRPDGSDVHRHQDVGPGRRAGQDHQHRCRPSGPSGTST